MHIYICRMTIYTKCAVCCILLLFFLCVINYDSLLNHSRDVTSISAVQYYIYGIYGRTIRSASARARVR